MCGVRKGQCAWPLPKHVCCSFCLMCVCVCASVPCLQKRVCKTSLACCPGCVPIVVHAMAHV